MVKATWGHNSGNLPLSPLEATKVDEIEADEWEIVNKASTQATESLVIIGRALASVEESASIYYSAITGQMVLFDAVSCSFILL